MDLLLQWITVWKDQVFSYRKHEIVQFKRISFLYLTSEQWHSMIHECHICRRGPPLSFFCVKAILIVLLPVQRLFLFLSNVLNKKQTLFCATKGLILKNFSVLSCVEWTLKSYWEKGRSLSDCWAQPSFSRNFKRKRESARSASSNFTKRFYSNLYSKENADIVLFLFPFFFSFFFSLILGYCYTPTSLSRKKNENTKYLIYISLKSQD